MVELVEFVGALHRGQLTGVQLLLQTWAASVQQSDLRADLPLAFRRPDVIRRSWVLLSRTRDMPIPTELRVQKERVLLSRTRDTPIPTERRVQQERVLLSRTRDTPIPTELRVQQERVLLSRTRDTPIPTELRVQQERVLLSRTRDTPIPTELRVQQERVLLSGGWCEAYSARSPAPLPDSTDMSASGGPQAGRAISNGTPSHSRPRTVARRHDLRGIFEEEIGVLLLFTGLQRPHRGTQVRQTCSDTGQIAPDASPRPECRCHGAFRSEQGPVVGGAARVGDIWYQEL